MNNTIASETLNELGLSKVCRACLSDEGEMKSVFIASNDNPNIKIFRMFECCTAVEIAETDGLPGLICAQCELRLNLAYYFRELCQRSNTTLRTYIENATRHAVKQEIIKPEEKYIIENYQEILNDENVEQVKHVEQNQTGEEEVEEEEQQQEEEEKYNDPENNDIDSDDQPLLDRQAKTSEKARYAMEIVNQAIDASKKKFNERKECKLCGFLSTNARGLSLHIAHLHKELRDKWCSICEDQFEDLSEHVKQHSKVRSYACTFCEKAFLSPGHLTEHIRSHSTERPFKCKECDKGFLSARHLKVHARIHSGEKPYSCPQCNRKFTQKGSLQGHIRTHTGFKPFQCEVCKKRCTTASALAIHRSKTGHKSFIKLVEIKNDIIPKEEPNEDPPNNENIVQPPMQFDDAPIDPILVETTASTSIDKTDKDTVRKLCTVCGKTFSTTSKLRLHMRVHTGETPYKCQHCPKQFTTRGQLVVHTRTHTGEKPHVCHVCGKGFAQSSVLSTHMKLHTGRPEQCQICEQRFCRPAELRLHMRKHTGEKPYLCSHCGHSFIQRSHLMEHLKIHSDERPYKCHICERGFKQSSSLKSHVQIHTGYKPYKCSQCPYACRQPYSLTQHMKTHSADQPIAEKPHVCLACHKGFTTLAMLTSHSRSVHHTIM